MVSLSISGSSAEVCVNSACTSFTLSFSFAESGAYSSAIGGEFSTFTSLVGFVWSFIIVDTYDSQGSYMGSSSTSCLTGGGCSMPGGYCGSLVVNDPETGASGCISTYLSAVINAGGVSCPAACMPLGGCSGTTCLKCACPSLSCMVIGSTNECWCPTNGITTPTTCTCPAGDYFDGNQCLSCDSSCATCTQALLCSTCTASNSYLDTVQGCDCNPGYYGTRPLTASNSCTACYSECSTCNQALICLTCIGGNAVPSSSQGCTCAVGYWGTAQLTSLFSCVQCYGECASCSQAISCLSCVAENASLSASGVCTCSTGYGGTAPLTSASSCHKCNADCQTCIQESLCTSCIATSALPSATEGCTCKSGYWGVSPLSSATSCSPCNTQCITCNSQNICITCNLPHASPVDSADMGCECNSGYYQDPLFATCLECPDFCETCIDSSTCIVCNVTSSNPNTNGTCSCPFFSVETDYSCVCKYGYYLDDAGAFSCNVCNASCSTCTGNSDSDCILCAGLLSFDEQNLCTVCPSGKYNKN